MDDSIFENDLLGNEQDEIIFFEEEPEQDENNLGTWKILIVDDEEAILRGLENMLGRMGYRVVATTNGREALKYFRTDPQGIDLVVTDQVMPELTGMELAREIFRLRSDIPIILFTGYSEDSGEREAQAQGIQELILKPLDTKALALSIRRVLDRNDRRPQEANGTMTSRFKIKAEHAPVSDSCQPKNEEKGEEE